MTMANPFGTTTEFVASTPTGANHLRDLRMFPSMYGEDKLYTRCQAVVQPDQATQKVCKFYKENNQKRCMYQKWPSMAVCDKVTDSDGRSVN